MGGKSVGLGRKDGRGRGRKKAGREGRAEDEVRRVGRGEGDRRMGREGEGLGSKVWRGDGTQEKVEIDGRAGEVGLGGGGEEELERVQEEGVGVGGQGT